MKVIWFLLAAAPHVVVLASPTIPLMAVDPLVIKFSGLDDSFTARLADYNSDRGAVVVRWQDSAGSNTEQKCFAAALMTILTYTYELVVRVHYQRSCLLHTAVPTL